MIFNYDVSDLQSAILSLQTAVSKTNISETVFKDTSDVCSDLNAQEYGIKGYSPTTSNIPEANTYGVCLCFGRIISGSTWEYQIAYQTNGEFYIRFNVNNGGWQTWRKVCTNSDDLNWTTLSSTAYPNKIVYSKKNGIVTVLGRDLSLTTTVLVTAGTMPSGFRTGAQIVSPMLNTGNGQTCGYISMATDGSLSTINRTGTSLSGIYFCFSYPVF